MQNRIIQSPVPMWMTAVIFVLFQFFLQLSSGVLLTHFMVDFHLNAFSAGLLASAFYFVYVLLQTPAGLVMDKYGPRRLLSGGAIVCGIGCLLIAHSQTFLLAMCARILMGLGASFAFVGSIYIVGEWFPKSRFALMVGLAETFGMFGTILGNVYLAKLIETLNWRYLMNCCAVIAWIIAVCCWALIRDHRNPRRKERRNFPWSEFYKGMRWIVTHTGLWWNGLYSGFMFSVVTVFATLWGIPFFESYLHVSQVMVCLVCSMVFVGTAMGAPVMGLLYPILPNKRLFLVGSAWMTAVLVTFLIYDTPKSLWSIGALFIFIGFGVSTYVINFTLADHLVPKHVRSTSIGFTNTLCMIPAPILQPLVGLLIHYFRPTHIALNQMAVEDFRAALWVIPAVVFVAGVIAFFIPTGETSAKKPRWNKKDYGSM